MSTSGEATSASPGGKIFKRAYEGSKWCQAIECGNCAEVMQLLKNDPNRLQKTVYGGRTALHAAVIEGWGEEVVQEILRMCKSGNGSASSSSQQSVIALRDLLDARDEEYCQTALAMAVVIGNGKVVRTIMRAYATEYDKNDDVRDDDEIHEVSQQRRSINEEMLKQFKKEQREQRQQDEEAEEQLRQQLRDIMPAIFKKISLSPEYTELLKYHCTQVMYRNELQEYVFHSICNISLENYILTTYADESKGEVKILKSIADYDRRSEFKNMQSNIMQSIVEEAWNTQPSLVPFLFKLQDNRGMTPLHAAVRSGEEYKVSKVLELIDPHEESEESSVNARDGAGRTPLHVAAAQFQYSEDYVGLEKLLMDPRTDVNATFIPLNSFIGLLDVWELKKLLTTNKADHGPYIEFELTALHLAILHNHSDRVKIILNHIISYQHTSCVHYTEGYLFPSWMPSQLKDAMGTPLNLAVITGQMETIRVMLEDDKVYDCGRIQNKSPRTNLRYGDISYALHVASCCGNLEIVTMILDDNNFDAMVEDTNGHTALHYATDAFTIDRAPFYRIEHLVDIESLRHMSTIVAISKGYSGKRGCINLLLQAGLNIWSKGRTKNTPTPGLLASEEDRAWWHEKVDNVTMGMKKNLTDGANAISVTAALVATASFVGPLQPPIGYSEGNMSIHYELLSVKIFIICDTLSFYLAIAAIMLSIIPSLPLLHAPLRRELEWTRRTVIIAVCLLLTSIIFVLVSFAAATIAVVPHNWSYRVSTFSTAMLGAVVCLMVLYSFTFRLVRLVFYKNVNIRRSYDGLAKFDVMTSFKKKFLTSKC